MAAVGNRDVTDDITLFNLVPRVFSFSTPGDEIVRNIIQITVSAMRSHKRHNRNILRRFQDGEITF